MKPTYEATKIVHFVRQGVCGIPQVAFTSATVSFVLLSLTCQPSFSIAHYKCMVLFFFILFCELALHSKYNTVIEKQALFEAQYESTASHFG